MIRSFWNLVNVLHIQNIKLSPQKDESRPLNWIKTKPNKTGVGQGSRINKEIGTDIYLLQYIKQITNTEMVWT